jgi:hypothetical protein
MLHVKKDLGRKVFIRDLCNCLTDSVDISEWKAIITKRESSMHHGQGGRPGESRGSSACLRIGGLDFEVPSVSHKMNSCELRCDIFRQIFMRNSNTWIAEYLVRHSAV